MENLSDGFISDINFVLQTKFALFSINRKRTTEYNYLKPKQVDCVKDALSADTLVILPTGYGKSLIYEVIQKITNAKIIVISPINAIINEQKNRFGDSAFCIEGDIIRIQVNIILILYMRTCVCYQLNELFCGINQSH